jgi:hypothetical protein
MVIVDNIVFEKSALRRTPDRLTIANCRPITLWLCMKDDATRITELLNGTRISRITP